MSGRSLWGRWKRVKQQQGKQSYNEPKRRCVELDTGLCGDRLPKMNPVRRHASPTFATSGMQFPVVLGIGLCLYLAASVGGLWAGEDRLILPGEVVANSEQTPRLFDLVILGNEPIKRPLIGAVPEYIARPQGGGLDFLIKSQQVGIRIEEAVFVAPSTTISWFWRKEKGNVCIVQFELINPATNQRRYFGYGAGALSEAVSGDPTVEVFLAKELPAQGVKVERNLFSDMQQVLGWEQAKIASVYLSPWDGEAGVFGDMVIRGASPSGPTAGDYRRLSRIGTGHYLPSKLPAYDGKPIERFDTSFEECAPGRNSNANEWSAFGAIGDRDSNCMGREMYVRYPLYDLCFRVVDAGKEVLPDTLDTFRLGLVNDRLPAVWGGWRHGDLLYKVSVMTVPDKLNGNFDLYKIEVQNPTDKAAASTLAAILEGPPDMRLEDGVARGLDGAPLLIADPPSEQALKFREWGLCDKRAKAYATGPGPGATEPAVANYRVGLDGVPVVYRVKAEPGRKYVVCLVSTPHISGYWLENPKQTGDLIYEYLVEGCPSQTLDYVEYIRKKSQPLCVSFDGAQDKDGDGYIEILSGVANKSRIKQTRLSVIYVFPEGTKIDDFAAVYSGSMNARCLRHIAVGATPEQSSQNQTYDKSDMGFARLFLQYGDAVPPHTTRTNWLKVPPIHRREPVSMGYIAHAFREILPGEAAPPFPAERVAALKAVEPTSAERRVVDFWNDFFAKAAQFDLPDPVLNDIFLSRLATRAILDIPISEQVVYNACSPFFYFDHAYRDQSYVVFANDLAGLHDRAAGVLRAYCLDVKDVKQKGPISFDGKPLQLGMLENGLWNTRPGQFDTQGQNIWALVEHYKLSGDRHWLEETGYPYIRRGAMWLVNSRQRHKQEVGDPNDLRYGLIEPGGMEVLEVGKGMHMYYMNAFGILGLREAADAARSLGRTEDYKLFAGQAAELTASLHTSFAKTFKRTGLYEGHLWFGVEPEGVGMYGFWAHCCLLWPCRALEPHDPMLNATWRKLEKMSQAWGGGLFSEGQGGYWPYIGVDWALSYILRGDPDRALDYFCAYVDKAGGTFSWGEGYGGVMAGGDQPHFWADAQYVNLFRHLFAMEDGSTLLVTPALFRRWHQGDRPVIARGLATHFGDLDLKIQPTPKGDQLDYTIKLSPRGDQKQRELFRMVLYPRTATGQPITHASVDGKAVTSFTDTALVISRPPRGKEIRVTVRTGPQS